MCGILGILDLDAREVVIDEVLRASLAMCPRGPDDEGYLLVDTRARRLTACRGADTDPRLNLPRVESFKGKGHNLALAFRRLSILDLSPCGHQPMSTPDGAYHIVFNGEVYNYVELRRELEALGHTFRSQGDTEVLLHAYVQWGPEALNRLVGMFGFAILDLERRRLFLARDFFAIKPLYCACWDGKFAFASEIKCLLEFSGLSRNVNPACLYEYLRFGIPNRGGQTLLSAIRQVPGGHYLDVSLDEPGQPEPVPYWQVDRTRRLDVSFEEAADRLRELFLENIRLHLRSDVPVGAALSGGIDSSAIVAGMRRVQGKDLEIHAFSYVADGNLSEEQWVDMVVSAAGAVSHKVHLKPEELVGDLEDLIYRQDEPFGSTSIYAQARVFRLAREAGVKVMLDGQGADELLAGYRPYLAMRLTSLLLRGEWIPAARFFRTVANLPGASGLQLLGHVGSVLLPRALQGPFRKLMDRDLSPVWLEADWFTERGVALRPEPKNRCRDMLKEELFQTLTRTGLPMLLRYEDRNSMGHSIESRVPFLTPAIVNFVFSLPEQYLIAPDGTTKAVFRKAMRGIVPDPILDRKDKIGFATPERAWLGVLRPWVEKTFQSPAAMGIPALRMEAAKAEWDQILQDRKAFDWRIWRWLNLIHWVERFGVTFE